MSTASTPTPSLSGLAAAAQQNITAPTTQPTLSPKVPRFISVLETVGKDFEKGLILVLGDVSKIATAEAPVLTTINPAWGTVASKVGALATQALAVATQTEQKFIALGQAPGTTAQKIAEGTLILLPAVGQILGLAGEQASSVSQQIVTAAFSVLTVLPQSILTSAAPAVAAAGGIGAS